MRRVSGWRAGGKLGPMLNMSVSVSTWNTGTFRSVRIRAVATGPM